MLLCNLVYPEIMNPVEEIPFTSVLCGSLKPEKITPAWCDNCQKFTPTLQTRQLTKLPQILTLNCGLDSQQDKAFWQNQMDLVVQRVINGKDASPARSPVPITIKPCRYGANCTRMGYRFRHAGRDAEAAVPTPATTPIPTLPSHLYYSHRWVPHLFEITLDPNENWLMSKLDKITHTEAGLNSVNNPIERCKRNSVQSQSLRNVEQKSDHVLWNISPLIIPTREPCSYSLNPLHIMVSGGHGSNSNWSKQ